MSRAKGARRKSSAGLLILVLVVVSLAAAAGEPGTFTGEVKTVVYVRDVEASAEYYADTLGLRFLGFAELDGEPYYAEMAAGGTKLGLHEPTSEGDAERVGRLKLYLRVRDLDDHRRRLTERGAACSPVRETSYMDMFSVDDPDGNRIVFALTDPERHTVDPWRAGPPG